MTRNRVLQLFILLFGITAVLYIFQLGGEQNRLITNILFLLPPAIAVTCGLLVVKTYGFKTPHGKTLLLLALGLLCWLVGESSFFIFQFVTKTDPFPSLADAFFLAGYPLLLAGLIKEIRISKLDLKNFNKFLLVLMALFMICLAFLVCYFGIYLAYSAEDPMLHNIVAIGYGVGDLILVVPIIFVMKLALDHRGGKLFYTWAFILFAVALTMIGDILFAIFNDEYTDLTWPYNMIDLLWVASYLLFAFSFYSTSYFVKRVRSKLR